MKTSPLLRSLFLSLALLASFPSFAAVKKEFNICWTIYAGWMPWGTISNEKIIDKWASKYGIKINIVQLNDYIESINQYTAGQFDGCTMTNMDALTIPAAGGVDTTALITGSYSDGNDGVVLKGVNKKLSDLKGMSVYLPELSVSHYLLVRGLEKAGLQEKDVKVVNTSDADIVSAFGTSNVRAAVAWNPQLSVIKKTPQTTEVFSSSEVPGELIDMMVVNTQTLKDNPALGKALTGAWFEMMSKMQAGDTQALSAMAADSGIDLAGYKAQLKTTHLFWTPADTLTFISSPDLAKTMQRVATFSFDKGLLGEGAQSADFIGMMFPGNTTVGNTANIKLRFDDSYLKMAAAGKL
ncbi:putative urea ABC transporter substrate-binding protein [Pantoea allii]|uniref:Urea ABC transporter substrate-binding protein n=1 Tax=Pantoea allii TaxID=574096 RepID=A0ABS6VF83_9GAMM|nr:putative urea ABC transporter substrate-binding protein [Pantoea allii]MBW1214595.1 putative urea ABC transporter substrate-binding protein [Pantoea allii]MBW1254022.1 putative urea ABC transporter substrate-binding protein [Pantoea allii]MBW1257805.1 putative urea ABC transporter substrate-binding protein [Pantoea allii]MBW1263065.1 putative urea ABC transporter substrate-binding protein [Pantoea allii]MBW1267003.1 putative urea ABC transporter substrate-binding protein [Pantoea allii]